VSVLDPGLPELPENALDDARSLLHAELAATFTAVGWNPERVDRYPLLTPLTPGGWVDAPTLSAQGAGLVATFPIVITVDGSDRTQVRRLDALLAIVWARLLEVRIPTGLRLAAGSTVEPVTAGPEQLDIGGPSTRSITLVVRVPIGPRTLCPTALTSPTGEPLS
jgi:hypothetical protein